ncbi:MAG: hypothetical protein SPG34_00240 [Trueperella sp.]|uniref:hypothetical protein n=1 Tax=Trueperella sp. TaxID=2699835 RepID=UPI002A91B86D|nr:hypothetical protein [Trueperella sp.]MDY5402755.1 hypothetical protein [Trueperella sp.]
MPAPKKIRRIALINAAFLLVLGTVRLWEGGAFNDGFNADTSTYLALLTPLIITFVVLSTLQILWEFRVARARTQEDQARLEGHRKHIILFGLISAVVLLALVFVW